MSNCYILFVSSWFQLKIGELLPCWPARMLTFSYHYNDVIMGAMASQITSLSIVYSNVYSVEDQRKHQSSASLAFLWGIHRWQMNSLHKWPVTRKMFPFDDAIMIFVNCDGCKIERLYLSDDNHAQQSSLFSYSDFVFRLAQMLNTNEQKLFWNYTEQKH